MLVAKEIEKFMSSEVYNPALGEQHKQGFRIGLTMKVVVNGKWATVDYYKALAVGATPQV
ncbi:hypothetical protein D8674_000005 [Pyrus ussuriensis x Pyrus communis]|uniref:Uncharacterized protein n=1 Tax=Pyrus ussuriensis x Pyrus communis TaxID=2448454 RepID=A0A5N5F279_9ROSA|nr:hypothetical protein D8674_000005 [Pyrus ussuriensis x Pyrus communis]